MVACAAFRKSVAISRSGSRVQVFRSAAGPVDGDPEAALARDIVSFYQGYWPADSAHDLNVIEMPTPLGEAIAFDGAIALSDKIIGSRNPGSAQPAISCNLSWRTRLRINGGAIGSCRRGLPAGCFCSSRCRNSRLISTSAAAGFSARTRRSETRSGVTGGSTRLGKHDVPLAEAETGDEIAYNKGPFALLSLDSLADRSLMRRLGG